MVDITTKNNSNNDDEFDVDIDEAMALLTIK